jgi:ATP-dependent DNA ligase
MSNENQGHTRADHQQAASKFECPNALGIVRHSTLWVKPKLVAVIKFLQWTDANHLRHAAFVALRTDKDPRTVVREDKAQYEREK